MTDTLPSDTAQQDNPAPPPVISLNGPTPLTPEFSAPIPPLDPDEIDIWADWLEQEIGPRPIEALVDSRRFAELFLLLAHRPERFYKATGKLLCDAPITAVPFVAAHQAPALTRFLDWATSGALSRRLQQSELVIRAEFAKRAMQAEWSPGTHLFQLAARAYASAFRALNADAIAALRKHVEGASILVLHISCRPRLTLAKTARDSYRTAAPSADKAIAHVIVVGKRADSYRFSEPDALLEVPAGDDYESLPQKVIAALTLVALADLNCCVLKTDDDIVARDPPKLAATLPDLAEQLQYLGTHNAWVGNDRTWHLGKTGAALRWHPFSRVYKIKKDQGYTQGPAYCLGQKALQTLAKAALYCEQEVTQALYEDLLVGLLLSQCDVPVHHYDFREVGLLSSRDDTSFTYPRGPDA